jgi:endonuclease-3
VNVAATDSDLKLIVDSLELNYGVPRAPGLTDPWKLVLWENVSLLSGDDRRAAAFEMLLRRVGVEPRRIIEAADEVLFAVARHGQHAAIQAEKLRDCARILLQDFDGDLPFALRRVPFPASARRTLMKFPNIGPVGADKILLLSRRLPVLAADSHGLRVLVCLRLGLRFGLRDHYREIRDEVAKEIDEGCDWFIRARSLLRRHGQEVCHVKTPQCDRCPLTSGCAYYQRRRPLLGSDECHASGLPGGP